jgi:hypothetical protein
MNTFAEKPNFSLKQVIAAIVVAFGIGGAAMRYESRSDAMEEKLDKLIAAADNKALEFKELSNQVAINTANIRAVTTSVTAFLKPEDINIRNKR